MKSQTKKTFLLDGSFVFCIKKRSERKMKLISFRVQVWETTEKGGNIFDFFKWSEPKKGWNMWRMYKPPVLLIWCALFPISILLRLILLLHSFPLDFSTTTAELGGNDVWYCSATSSEIETCRFSKSYSPFLDTWQQHLQETIVKMRTSSKSS